MTVSFNCATFNVGTVQDLKDLASAKNEKISNYQALNRYRKNLSVALPFVFENLDFVCMQEMLKGDAHPEHVEVEKALDKLGYHYSGNERVGVAYHKANFAECASGSITVSKKDPKVRPSFYVDLKHIRTGKIIRVISAHLKGYNVREQKEMTRESKADGCPNPRVLISKKRSATKLGDVELTETLKHVFKVNQEKPDLFIIGLDANATARYIPEPEKRVHSFRLKKMDTSHFKCDMQDTLPTIFDKADGIPRKFDYIFARTPDTHPEVQIQSQPGFDLERIRHQVLMSDHVPVFARVTIHW